MPDTRNTRANAARQLRSAGAAADITLSTVAVAGNTKATRNTVHFIDYSVNK